ncbi:MAG: hypothetical protein MZW92_73535 [Comamonadaceae bacterium]|nr:hypothetical protein [Comamonadaceae bacterium]
MRFVLSLFTAAALLTACAAMQPPQPGWSEQQTLAHWGAADLALCPGRRRHAPGVRDRPVRPHDLDGRCRRPPAVSAPRSRC